MLSEIFEDSRFLFVSISMFVCLSVRRSVCLFCGSVFSILPVCLQSACLFICSTVWLIDRLFVVGSWICLFICSVCPLLSPPSAQSALCSVGPPLCLPACLSCRLSAWVCLSVERLSVYLFACLSACLFVTCVSVYLLICCFTSFFVCSHVCSSVWSFVYLSVFSACRFICLLVCLLVCLSVGLSI